MEARDLVSTALPTLCAATVLPASAVVSLGNGGGSFTLDAPALYRVPCATLVARSDDSSLNSQSSSGSNPKISDFRDPFYASTFPICYALAACTITAYMLVIILFITPRSFLDGSVRHLSRRSFTKNSAYGVSVGGRPLLQKIAALTVAASLTVATASTFRIAEIQYAWGAQNAKVLQNEVMDGTELKIIRIISDTCLWMAQAQTLIRLFPRQREKTIIKWVAFLLITLDVIFSTLNSFLYPDNEDTGVSRPRSFSYPVPTLSYLLQLTLGVLYAAWVLYYAIMKRRFAFYHPLMKNICLVALISVGAITTPVIFFILDLSEPGFTGWGGYVRWVGAAAASVVVWEWVERIEALEREVKKDGVLGREVFHEDDMLEVNASEPLSYGQRKFSKGAGDGGEDGGGRLGLECGERQHGFAAGYGWPGQYLERSSADHEGGEDVWQRSMGGILPAAWPARPTPARTTPVSRTDSPSAASTVYAVQYQGGPEGVARTPEAAPPHSMADLGRESSTPPGQSEAAASARRSGAVAAPDSRRSDDIEPERRPASQASRRRIAHESVYSYSRGGDGDGDGDGDPGTVRGARSRSRRRLAMSQGAAVRARDSFGRWDLGAKLEMLAANQADRFRERLRPTVDTASLPLTVVPAPARHGAALQRVLEEAEVEGAGGQQASNDSSSRDSAASGGGGEIQIAPPLWPGVQRRLIYDDDDDEEESYDEESMTESASSIDQSPSHSEGGPGAV